MDEPPVTALLEAVGRAQKKSGVQWVRVGNAAPRAAWGQWLDGGLHLVVGPGEQEVPGLLAALDAGTPVAVTTPAPSTRAALLTWRAAGERLLPGSAAWEAVVPLLVAKRLNLPAGEDTAARWAASCAVVRLVPTE